MHWLAFRQQAESEPYQLSVYFPSPAASDLLRVAGAGRLAADIYWLAFIQYAGDSQRRQVDHWQLADDYLKTVTQFDPHFVQPYWFAAFTVGADEKRPDLAAEIIEQGINRNPGNWYLPYIAGINQFLYANNDRVAARYYTLASSLPGAPPYIGDQAGILASGAPSYLSRARALETACAHENDPVVKEKALQAAASAWKEVLRLAPNDAYREAARSALGRLPSHLPSD